jgi:glutaryl-CoA dehydrogenase
LLLQYYYKKLNMKPDLFNLLITTPWRFIDRRAQIIDSARAWVKREVSPIIEEYAQSRIPKQILKGLADIGGFGPYIPEEYGGAGLDQISYGLMQEIERGDSEYVLLLRFNRL